MTRPTDKNQDPILDISRYSATYGPTILLMEVCGRIVHCRNSSEDLIRKEL